MALPKTLDGDNTVANLRILRKVIMHDRHFLNAGHLFPDKVPALIDVVPNLPLRS